MPNRLFPSLPSLPSLTVLCVVALGLAASCGPKPGVRRAQALLDAGDYRGAVNAADEELIKTPDEPALWRLKIRAELLTGDSDAAIALYRRWRERRGADDRVALGEMAELTLWRGLTTPSAELNIAAIKSIEKHQLVRLADEVTALIASDDDEVAATAAIAVLRDHPQAANVAAARLSSPNPRARAIVVRGITRKILERAQKEIRDALLDSDAVVRIAGIAGVVKLKDRSDTAALAKLARFDPKPSVRVRAARALARKPYFPDLELARALALDPFIGARLAALELANSKSDTGGRDLLRAATQGDELAVAMRAAVLLGPGPSAGPIFARALASPKWSLRAAALTAILAATDRKTSIAAATEKARDPELGVRLAAARLFVRLGDVDSARPLFQAALEGPSPDLSAALAMVRHYPDAGAKGRQIVATIAREPERGRRSAAIAAFAELGIGASGIDDALVASLADKAPALRMAAADVIVTLLRK